MTTKVKTKPKRAIPESIRKEMQEITKRTGKRVVALELCCVVRAVMRAREQMPSYDTFACLEEVGGRTTSAAMAQTCRWYMRKLEACEKCSGQRVFFDKDPHHKMGVREYARHDCDRAPGMSAEDELKMTKDRMLSAMASAMLRQPTNDKMSN